MKTIKASLSDFCLLQKLLSNISIALFIVSHQSVYNEYSHEFKRGQRITLLKIVEAKFKYIHQLAKIHLSGYIMSV